MKDDEKNAQWEKLVLSYRGELNCLKLAGEHIPNIIFFQQTYDTYVDHLSFHNKKCN